MEASVLERNFLKTTATKKLFVFFNESYQPEYLNVPNHHDSFAQRHHDKQSGRLHADNEPCTQSKLSHAEMKTLGVFRITVLEEGRFMKTTSLKKCLTP